MAEVQASNINLSFGALKALDDVSLRFPDGEFFGLLGPSGSGKTTLLRVIAGFLFADSGTVKIGDEPVETVPVEKREIGMVFQNYALFPNMSVADNVGFGLKVRKQSSAEVKRKTAEALDLVQLGDLGARRPHELSGGQRQRVALARAIVTEPRVLLLDEPLSALDKALRVDMQIELKRIQREIGITTIFVTHDQEEALTLSDRIGILRDGKLVQEGPPKEMYNAPVDRFAAGFLGEANFFEGERTDAGLRLKDGTTVTGGSGARSPAEDYSIAVRPENFVISAEAPARDSGTNVLKAKLLQRIFAGPTVTCLLEWQDQTIKVLTKEAELQGIDEMSDVWLNWPRKGPMFLPAN